MSIKESQLEENVLHNCTRESLLKMIKSLHKENRSLKEELDTISQSKKSATSTTTTSADDNIASEARKRKKKTPRPFPWHQYTTRHIALQIAYVGWEYHGLAVQTDEVRTVEEAVLSALQRARLIESLETCDLQRSGRTDTGVSAYRQVLSLRVRSVCKSGVGVRNVDEAAATRATHTEVRDELDYAQLINPMLPPDICAISWSPVSDEFSARFNTRARRYRYFFVRESLDVDAMHRAAQSFVGEHDFRNFCKLNVDAVTHCRRGVQWCRVVERDAQQHIAPRWRVCEFEVRGKAFLWHQIRCMISVLFLVGQGKEDETIVANLLSVEKVGAKPLYKMADGTPLVLFECDYDNEDVQWQFNYNAIRSCVERFSALARTHLVRFSVLDSMRSHLENDLLSLTSVDDSFDTSTKSPPTKKRRKSSAYVPLLERTREESMESRLEEKKRKKEKERKKQVEEAGVAAKPEKDVGNTEMK